MSVPHHTPPPSPTAQLRRSRWALCASDRENELPTVRTKNKKLKWGQSVLLNRWFCYYHLDKPFKVPFLRKWSFNSTAQIRSKLGPSRAFKKLSWLSAQAFKAANAEVEDIGIDTVSTGQRQIDKEVLISDASSKLCKVSNSADARSSVLLTVNYRSKMSQIDQVFVLCINYRSLPYMKFPVPRPGVYKAGRRQS